MPEGAHQPLASTLVLSRPELNEQQEAITQRQDDPRPGYLPLVPDGPAPGPSTVEVQLQLLYPWGSPLLAAADS